MSEEGEQQVTAQIPRRLDSATFPAALSYNDLNKGAPLGVGSNAVVYAATGPNGTPLALKEPYGDPASTRLHDRFANEAAAWERVADHRNIVTLCDAGTEPQPWLAMERVDGGTLREYDPSVAETLWMGARLADALASAHEAGVAHLDVTPRNVLLRSTEGDTWQSPALTDWGVATLLAEEFGDVEALSPRYAAPEELSEDGANRGVHTDIFRLGAVLYEALTGNPPFDEPLSALPEAVQTRRPPPPTGVDPSLPVGVDAVLDRALAAEPAARYDSAAGFADALATLFTEETGQELSLPDRNPPATVSTGTAPAYGQALALDGEGFVKLTPAYFARREPAPLIEAWRRGLALVDVWAGRAVTRSPPDDAYDSLQAAVCARLRAGTDVAVLGPPAAGKSAVCKQVACEWVAADYGPVVYREGDADATFDRPAAVAETLARADGRPLVVVEDAVRPDAQAVFALTARLDEAVVLVDARESEWRDAGTGTDPLGSGPDKRDQFDTLYVPRPDETAHERFIEKLVATDSSSTIDPDRLREDIRQERTEDDPRPGELFSVIHRLTALATDATEEAASTLTEAVEGLRAELAALSEPATDVGMAVNLLNAAGLSVRPELVHAVAPEQPGAVADAIELLDGRVLFPREADWADGTVAYPAVHETWSTTYLKACLDADETAASRRFGRVVSRLLAVASDADRRERIRELLHDDAPYLDRIADDPVGWVETTVRAVFEIGVSRPALAPLFGDPGEVDLPAICPDGVAAQASYLRGEMYREHGALDRAERAFRRLETRATDAETNRGDRWRAMSATGFGTVARERGNLERAERHHETARALYATLGDQREAARVDRRLGNVAYKSGDLAAAEAHYQRGLDRCRQADDEYGAAKLLLNLGNIAHGRGENAAAEERYEASLDRFQTFGDRRHAAFALLNLGAAARERGDLEQARQSLQEGLSVCRQLGHRRGEVTALLDLGTVLREQDELALAEDYLSKGLTRCRDIGDQGREAHLLAELGAVAREQREYATARDRLTESLSVCQNVGDRHGKVGALLELGRLAREEERLEDARNRFAAAAQECLDAGFRETRPAVMAVVEVCDRLGDTDAAVEWCDRAVDFADRTDRQELRTAFAERRTALTDP